MTEREKGGQGAAIGAEDAVLLVAGAVDLVLEQAEGALRRARALLGRSDLLDLAMDARDDLIARGRNSGLHTPRFAGADPHLEELARRARRRAEQAAAGGTAQGPAGSGHGAG
ncbi:hypothetical protein LG634_03680 [Streptomyces bambusae]|uniref:hypothetical protein n=1 Tax=Streptomyces bambusae TaxID=1550616 RepID=UPI001CFE70F8|nr:hypothetical protein [Streptomyces bambusae]MCB5163937.1 hypothetical protein [Streptomyces bambusae]